jgi:hypothetical protein
LQAQRRPRSWSAMLLLALMSLPLAAATPGEHRVSDLYYGQALFQYFQQNELAAITQLMVAAERPRHDDSQPDETRLLLADLFYGYGLYEESRGLFAQLLDAEVSASVQNRIWFNLARLRYQQGYYDHASDLLSRIADRLPARIEAERKYLLTNLHLDKREYQQAADISSGIDPSSIWRAYARYNLAVALIEDEHYRDGQVILDDLGQMDPADAEFLALRDLANLSLGLKQLRMSAPDAALQRLSRVRLEGPLSNQALLASGWARYRMQQFDKAQVPWQLLLRRNAVDAATQEAILAIPANYAESGQDRRAIQHYEIAANQFDLQLEMLQGAIRAIQNRELITALRDSAILRDRGQLQSLPPSSSVTPQLHLLLASSGFQREVKRYQELLDIRESLGHWSNSLPTLELMLSERRRAFEDNLPVLQETGSFAQLETLTRQRDQFAARLDRIVSHEDYLALAQPQEREHMERLQRVADSIGRIAAQQSTGYQQDMLRLLSGLLNYQLATEYPARLWQARKQMLQLNSALDVAEARALKLRQITQQTDLEFSGFDNRIRGQSARIEGLRERVDKLLQQQENRINEMATEAIREQQQHIVQLRLNARFELARIYDKLAATQ